MLKRTLLWAAVSGRPSLVGAVVESGGWTQLGPSGGPGTGPAIVAMQMDRYIEISTDSEDMKYSTAGEYGLTRPRRTRRGFWPDVASKIAAGDFGLTCPGTGTMDGMVYPSPAPPCLGAQSMRTATIVKGFFWHSALQQYGGVAVAARSTELGPQLLLHHSRRLMAARQGKGEGGELRLKQCRYRQKFLQALCWASLGVGMLAAAEPAPCVEVRCAERSC